MTKKEETEGKVAHISMKSGKQDKWWQTKPDLWKQWLELYAKVLFPEHDRLYMAVGSEEATWMPVDWRPFVAHLYREINELRKEIQQLEKETK